MALLHSMKICLLLHNRALPHQALADGQGLSTKDMVGTEFHSTWLFREALLALSQCIKGPGRTNLDRGNIYLDLTLSGFYSTWPHFFWPSVGKDTMAEACDRRGPFTSWEPVSKTGTGRNRGPNNRFKVSPLKTLSPSFRPACQRFLCIPKGSLAGPSLQHMTHHPLRGIQGPNSSKHGIPKDLHNPLQDLRFRS